MIFIFLGKSNKKKLATAALKYYNLLNLIFCLHNIKKDIHNIYIPINNLILKYSFDKKNKFLMLTCKTYLLHFENLLQVLGQHAIKVKIF